MEKNKTPIWENIKDYNDEFDFIVASLLSISDREFQMRIWCRGEGPEVDSYSDAVWDFDYTISYMKDLLRKKEISLTPEQIKAILRVHAMFIAFDRKAWTEGVPEDWIESHTYHINHPYWIKVTEKAKYALSLLKKPVF